MKVGKDNLKTGKFYENGQIFDQNGQDAISVKLKLKRNCQANLRHP